MLNNNVTKKKRREIERVISINNGENLFGINNLNQFSSKTFYFEAEFPLDIFFFQDYFVIYLHLFFLYKQISL